MKSANQIIDLKFFLGCFFYLCGALIWVYILRIFPLSYAFPVAASGLIICTSLTGFFFLKETISTNHLLSILLILAGIIFLSITK